MPPPLFFDSGIWKGRPVHFRRDHLCVKVSAPSDSAHDIESTLAQALDGIVSNPSTAYRVGSWALVQTEPGNDILVSVKDLEQKSDVVFAEPDLLMRVATEPNDTYIKSGTRDAYGNELRQWGAEKIGMYTAWDVQPGDDTVLIAVVDSGIALKAGADGVLSPGDVAGAFVEHADIDGGRILLGNDLLLPGNAAALPRDTTGHGTAMTGIIAATPNNSIGLAGINWGAPVLIVRVVEGSNTSSGLVHAGIAEAVEVAGALGKKCVISLSVTYADDLAGVDIDTVKEMVETVASVGAILCCAAGAGPKEVAPPAAIAASAAAVNNVLAVGATAEDDTIWPNSNFGGTVYTNAGELVNVEVSVVAPGDKIYTLDLVAT